MEISLWLAAVTDLPTTLIKIDHILSDLDSEMGSKIQEMQGCPVCPVLLDAFQIV